jgi:NAD(P)-dependent dehydrogenase (short-subunit alcohol dehydrogenase family)
MTDLTYEGKVAIITGAGGGLGRAHALLLASRGAQIVINDIGGSVSGEGNDAGPAAKVLAEIEAAGGIGVTDANSVSTPEGGEAIVQTALDNFGRVDIVINNAGILRDKSFHNMEPELVDAVLDVHLRGAFNVTRPAYRLMREQKYGRIISTASGAGVFGNFGQTNYGAAKLGLVGFTRSLAVEGAKNNIKANAIVPVAATRMTENLLGDLDDKLTPDLISPIVAFLAHADCPVSGKIFGAGGGRVYEIFLGVTRGYFAADLSLEDVRDNFAQIEDTSDYVIPDSLGADIKMTSRALQGRPLVDAP